MKHQHIKAVRSAITAVALMASALAAAAQTTDNRAPEVPSTIQVEEGNKVHFKAYATGVQIYRWNGTAWRFVAPEAMLFDMDGGIVGIHYVGPTWESASGSKVVGTRVNGAPSPNGSIDWLLLSGMGSGAGIFEGTTFIQRVNTTGGVIPSYPGTSVGDEARVPYTADYYFYRAK